MPENGSETQVDVIRIKVASSGTTQTAKNLNKVADAMKKVQEASKNLNNNTAFKKFQEQAQSAKDDVVDLGKEIVEVKRKTQKTELHPKKEMEDADKTTKKTTKTFGEFFKSIKRIAMYRLIRSALKSITEAVKTGISNLYQYDKAVNGDFSKSMDKIATSSLYVKNALGALFESLVVSAAPVIEGLTDRLVDLFNTINYATAVAEGKTEFTVAKKYMTEYAQATERADKAVRHLLGGIDELNILGDTQNGSGSATNYAEMFERVKIEDADQHILDLSSRINNFSVSLVNLGAGAKVATDLLLGLFNVLTDITNLLSGTTSLSDFFNNLASNSGERHVIEIALAIGGVKLGFAALKGAVTAAFTGSAGAIGSALSGGVASAVGSGVSVGGGLLSFAGGVLTWALPITLAITAGGMVIDDLKSGHSVWDDAFGEGGVFGSNGFFDLLFHPEKRPTSPNDSSPGNGILSEKEWLAQKYGTNSIGATSPMSASDRALYESYVATASSQMSDDYAGRSFSGGGSHFGSKDFDVSGLYDSSDFVDTSRQLLTNFNAENLQSVLSTEGGQYAALQAMSSVYDKYGREGATILWNQLIANAGSTGFVQRGEMSTINIVVDGDVIKTIDLRSAIVAQNQRDGIITVPIG